MKTAFAFVLCLLSLVLFADTIDLRSGDSLCKVDVEHGARIVSWKVAGRELLWNPSEAPKEDGRWRHGGIPLVWPWQGDEWPTNAVDKAPHGVAWKSRFERQIERDFQGNVVPPKQGVTLFLEAEGLKAEYKIWLGDRYLRLTLKTKNVSAEPRPYAMSFHPYFYLKERDKATVGGVNGFRYRDALCGCATNGVWKGWLPLTAWTDLEFFCGDKEMSVYFLEEDVNRCIFVFSSNAQAFWVWNPGKEWTVEGMPLYGGLEKDAWRHILSVEPSTVSIKKAVPLKPGEEQTISAEFNCY